MATGVYLRDAINKRYEGPQTYQNLINILNQAKADITCFGTRCIYVEGYKGTYPIDSLFEGLVLRVDRLVKENIEFNEEERAIGKQLTDRIEKLYGDSCDKIESKWFWTRFFVLLREVPAGILGAPSNAMFYDADHHYCCWYTKNQYKTRFGKEPPLTTNPHRIFWKSLESSC